jgi:hypothetical protein
MRAFPLLFVMALSENPPWIYWADLASFFSATGVVLDNDVGSFYREGQVVPCVLS